MSALPRRNPPEDWWEPKIHSRIGRLRIRWLHGSPAWVMAALSIVLSLRREQLVLVIMAILLYELVDRIRRRSRGNDAMRLAAFLTGPVVLAAGTGDVHVRLGTGPKADDAGSLSVPPMGWIETFRVSYGSENPGQSQSPDRVHQ